MYQELILFKEVIKIQPIFKEQIKMWSDLGFNIPVTEGFYWLDRGIVKAFSADGKLHKLYKYKVNDDLTITIMKHKEYCGFIPESWKETFERLKDILQNKIDESLKVIKSTFYKLFISCSITFLTSSNISLVVHFLPSLKNSKL